jgi:hypothetical protein
MDADGANARLLFELESIYWPAYGILDRLAWSPDGTRLAFIADFSSFTGADGGRGLYVANLDGSDQRQIPAKEPFSPVWSPDGNFIAYVAGGYEDPRGIIVTNWPNQPARRPHTFGTLQIDWTAGAVETQVTGAEVTNRNLTSVIDLDEYPRQLRQPRPAHGFVAHRTPTHAQFFVRHQSQRRQRNYHVSRHQPHGDLEHRRGAWPDQGHSHDFRRVFRVHRTNIRSLRCRQRRVDQRVPTR